MMVCNPISLPVLQFICFGISSELSTLPLIHPSLLPYILPTHEFILSIEFTDKSQSLSDSKSQLFLLLPIV